MLKQGAVMKTIFTFITSIMLLGIVGCDRAQERGEIENQDEVGIERQEEYEGEQINEVDRDVLGDDEVELND